MQNGGKGGKGGGSKTAISGDQRAAKAPHAIRCKRRTEGGTGDSGLQTRRERTRAAAAGNPGGRRGWLLGTRGQRQTERWQSIYRATRALIHFAVVEEMMSTATATERSTKEYDLAIPPQTSY